MMGSKKHSRLPAEYQEVEWIFAHTSNRPHITITFPAVEKSSFFGVRIKFRFTGTNGCYFNDVDNAGNFRRNSYTGGTDATSVGNVASGGGMSFSWPSTQVFQLDTLGKTIDGNFTSLPRPLWASIYRIDFLGNGSHGNCYYIQILAGIVVYNCIPCYRKSDNKTGVYCLELEEFFPNLGPVEFQVGPEV